jgi:hypothetical protein
MVKGWENSKGRRKMEPKDVAGDDICGEVVVELGSRDQLLHEAVFLTLRANDELALVQGKGNLVMATIWLNPGDWQESCSREKGKYLVSGDWMFSLEYHARHTAREDIEYFLDSTSP